MGIDIMEQEKTLDDIIENLSDIDYNTIAEKVNKIFPEYYTTFKEQFVTDDGAEPDSETKKEMIKATYSMLLQLISNALNELEYAHLLSLSITNFITDSSMTFDDYTLESMRLTDKFVTKIANDVDVSFNHELSDLLIKFKEENYE